MFTMYNVLLQVNTVVQIMHSVGAGHTILMCQTDEIHESFYDLFNQRFSSIKDPKHGTRFYTSIAIGAYSKLCRVNPAFRCIVVIKKSEVEDTPSPFLSRFEKYYLSHQRLLETVLSKMPPNLRILLKVTQNKVRVNILYYVLVIIQFTRILIFLHRLLNLLLV